MPKDLARADYVKEFIDLLEARADVGPEATMRGAHGANRVASDRRRPKASRAPCRVEPR